MKNALFADRVGVLATMHQKERVIAPLLKQELGIKVVVPQNFDTDLFGTFTREIKRPGDQIEAARLKAEKALSITGESLAFASEGTFSPHPLIPYIPCNKEIVILLDRTNNLEIVGQEFSTETNFSHQLVATLEEAYEFALKVGFPEHGIVVISDFQTTDKSEIIKGITTKEQLSDAVTFGLTKSTTGKVHIETDMRALYNPTRMKNIEKATQDLLKKINQLCPKCSWPGFEVVERKKGLPCALCNLPTQITHSVLYKCKKCELTHEVLLPDGLEKADPSQCMYCNP
jgi:DNA-directed RNA polymerase subunit RPC12/RpoP